MSLQKLCYLINEKNKLAIKRRSTRHKLYRLNQIANARNLEQSKWSAFKCPTKWLIMLERDFRVVYMEADLAFKAVNLDIAKHTQAYAEETRSLSRELGGNISYGSDNIVERLFLQRGDEGVSIRLESKDIEDHAIKHEFELIFFNQEKEEA